LSNGDSPSLLTRIDLAAVTAVPNYNQMVNRLEQLEQFNRQRTMSLEQGGSCRHQAPASAAAGPLDRAPGGGR
jgi:hypothetical protein